MGMGMGVGVGGALWWGGGWRVSDVAHGLEPETITGELGLGLWYSYGCGYGYGYGHPAGMPQREGSLNAPLV